MDEPPEQLRIIALNHVEPLIHDHRGDAEGSKSRAYLLARLQERNEDVEQRLEYWFCRPVRAERIAEAQPERLDDWLLARHAQYEAPADLQPLRDFLEDRGRRHHQGERVEDLEDALLAALRDVRGEEVEERDDGVS